MTRRSTDYESLRARLEFDDDGLPMRQVGPWTLDKLGLLAYYLPEFAKICRDKVGGWYFVDGFAGNGANRAIGFASAKGTALIGTTVQPEPRYSIRYSILVEKNVDDAECLRGRLKSCQQRIHVETGDANLHLPNLLRDRLKERHLPGFCVLDPEGLELNWATVKACASHRARGTPYELLVYFSTPGASRSGAVRHPAYVSANQARLTAVFGSEEWRPIAERQASGGYRPGEASKEYLALYERQLRSLGYETVLKRPAFREDGGLVYHMVVFASANETGGKIMTSAFERAYVHQFPLQY